jgi:hypothetical protein
MGHNPLKNKKSPLFLSSSTIISFTAFILSCSENERGGGGGGKKKTELLERERGGEEEDRIIRERKKLKLGVKYMVLL